MARKRKAGGGTVRQRKDGRWEGRIVIGYDDNGYPKTKNVLAKTKKECVEKLQKLNAECGGLKPEKVRPEMPFGDWLTYWYENHSKPKIRPTTQETYESRIRLHIIPEIGDIPLNKLTQNDLQQFYGRLKKSGRKRFTDKYGEKVKVYTIGDVSCEICGGPHVKNTSELQGFKIKKEESSAAGVRRIKAVVGRFD